MTTARTGAAGLDAKAATTGTAVGDQDAVAGEQRRAGRLAAFPLHARGLGSIPSLLGRGRVQQTSRQHGSQFGPKCNYSLGSTRLQSVCIQNSHRCTCSNANPLRSGQPATAQPHWPIGCRRFRTPVHPSFRQFLTTGRSGIDHTKAGGGRAVAQASTPSPPPPRPSLPRSSSLPRLVPKTRGRVGELRMDTILGTAGKQEPVQRLHPPRPPLSLLFDQSGLNLREPPIFAGHSKPRSLTRPGWCRGDQHRPRWWPLAPSESNARVCRTGTACPGSLGRVLSHPP